jgi:N-methylhydantoinase A
MTVTGLMQKPSPRQVEEGSATPDKSAILRTKDVYFRDASGFVATPVYARTKLRRGNEISGPALIEEHASTTVIQPGDKLVVDAFGNLLVTIGA